MASVMRVATPFDMVFVLSATAPNQAIMARKMITTIRPYAMAVAPEVSSNISW